MPALRGFAALPGGPLPGLAVGRGEPVVRPVAPLLIVAAPARGAPASDVRGVASGAGDALARLLVGSLSPRFSCGASPRHGRRVRASSRRQPAARGRGAVLRRRHGRRVRVSSHRPPAARGRGAVLRRRRGRRVRASSRPPPAARVSRAALRRRHGRRASASSRPPRRTAVRYAGFFVGGVGHSRDSCTGRSCRPALSSTTAIPYTAYKIYTFRFFRLAESFCGSVYSVKSEKRAGRGHGGGKKGGGSGPMC